MDPARSPNLGTLSWWRRPLARILMNTVQAREASARLPHRDRCFAAAANRIRPLARAFCDASALRADAGANGTPSPQDHAEKDPHPPDVLDIAIVGGGMMGLAVAYAMSNMPLTKHLRVAIIDSNPALKSRSYLGKNSIPDSRVSTVTPATISFFKGCSSPQLTFFYALLAGDIQVFAMS
ncbi:FAD/NAD(P)-binding oxidoreductase family protein [Zea mays]|uniref:FAD/NAD(P)-binding oxidoreductase family protein n=1 Tax=Zea mays TaxID=4577 RepID=A0A1D6KDD0_MAIZE|nr:FAD/NAD(P)-binding oxidoreductase family protein [Zea mays]